jgi:uncharacterized protein (TIGR00369 family)
MSEPANPDDADRADADRVGRRRARIAQIISAVPQLVELGVIYGDHGEGWLRLDLPYADKLVGYPETGVIAGGAIYTLMDTACGFSVSTKAKGFIPTATIDLRIDYLKPATPGLTIHGWAECYKLTRRVAFVRGVAYHDDRNRPIAHVTGTFMVSSADSGTVSGG